MCSQPSLSIASAVLSGSLRYPRNTFFPFTQTWNKTAKLWEVTMTYLNVCKMTCHYLAFTVGCKVIHILNINKFHSITWNRNSNMSWIQRSSGVIYWGYAIRKAGYFYRSQEPTSGPVTRHGERTGSGAFCLPICLENLESRLKKKQSMGHCDTRSIHTVIWTRT